MEWAIGNISVCFEQSTGTALYLLILHKYSYSPILLVFSQLISVGSGPIIRVSHEGAAARGDL